MNPTPIAADVGTLTPMLGAPVPPALGAPVPRPFGRVERTGFEIGWDLAHHHLVPPADHLHAGNPVRDGWEAGCAVFGVRTLQPTPQARKWLQLRLNAWTRGKAFDGTSVTPGFLRQIDAPACPITSQALTHGTGTGSDASVDRVNNGAGYAVGNLAVMSTRANQVKSDHDWRDAVGFARQIEQGRLGQSDSLSAGLTAKQWARLAVLMSFCTPLAHAEAAALPLLVMPPARLRVLNPAQVLQIIVTQRFMQPGQPARADRVAALFPAALRPAVQDLMKLLLARRIGAGPCPAPAAVRRAMEAAWAEPVLLRIWQRVAGALSAAQCEQLVDRLVGQRLAPHDWRCLPLDQATEGWALEAGGLFVAGAAEDGELGEDAGGAWPMGAATRSGWMPSRAAGAAANASHPAARSAMTRYGRVWRAAA